MSISDSTGKLVDTFTDFFKTRVSSKLGGTFLLSWILFNWELIYYFFATIDSGSIKILRIKEYLIFTDVFCYPLGIAFLYVIFYPIFAEIGEFLWTFNQNFVKRRAKLFLEGKIPISPQEKRTLLSLIRETSEKHKADIEEKDQQISSLEALLVDSTGQDFPKTDIESKSKEPDGSLNSEAMNVNQESLSKIFRSDDGRHLVRDWLAKLLHLDKDNPIHKQELNENYSVFVDITAMYPKPWTPQSVKGYNPDRTSQYPVQKTTAVALKLSKLNVLDKGKDSYSSAQPAFELSESSRLELNMIFLGLDQDE